MSQEDPFILVEDLDGSTFSIYDSLTLDVAVLDGELLEGLSELDADAAFRALESWPHPHLVTEGGRGLETF